MNRLLYGFTLIEVLVVVAIIGLLTGIGIASYNNFNEKQQVQQAAMNFATELRNVQKRVNSGERPKACNNFSLNSYQVQTTDAFPNAQIQVFCSGYVGGTPPDPEQFSLGQNAVFIDSLTLNFKTLNQGLDSPVSQDIKGKNTDITYTVTAEAGGVITVTEGP